MKVKRYEGVGRVAEGDAFGENDVSCSELKG